MIENSFSSYPSNHGLISRWLTTVVACILLTLSINLPAEEVAMQQGVPNTLSAENLEALVAPIALYPDDLVAIILPAATNPLQIVQADRFLEQRKTDPNLSVDEKLDDAVKSLLNYPEVVKKMSTDLNWTTSLGEAVATDLGAVLESVQIFRRKTHSVGNLKSDEKQEVIIEKEVIKIVPSDPQVIYVPQYNPTTIIVNGGYPYTYYPAPYPVYYYPYPPGAAFATGLIWGAAISHAWHGGHYHTDWGRGDNHININKKITINGGDRTNNIGNGSGNQGGSSQWKSSKQPGQVSGRASLTRPGDNTSKSSSNAWRNGSASGRQNQVGSSRNTPNHDSRVRSSTQGSSALNSNSSGRQTQMESSRGASSRSKTSSSASSLRNSATSRGRNGGGRRR